MIETIRKHYKIIIIVAILGLLGWRLYQSVFGPKKSAPGQNGSTVVAVELSPVLKKTIDDVGLFTGSLLPRSQFTMAPKISGRLEKVLVNIGDPVRYNQLIAVMDDDEYSQQVEKARAELEVVRATIEEARSSLEMARRDFERVRPLHQKGIASDSELDAAQASLNVRDARRKVALAQLNQREAALKESLVRLSYTEIRASWEMGGKGGELRVVGRRFLDEGAMLTPNTPIVSILDINSLIAVIHVIERDYPKVQTGMEAEITTDAFPGRIFTGRIARIAPQLMVTSRQARVEIEISNPDYLLKPGMYIRAKIVFGTHEDASVIPLVALVKRHGNQGVFLADTQNMKARFVPVTLGIVNGELAEVTAPAISGSVVSMGQHLIEDGATINVPESGTGQKGK
jgi:RND family efflux transporter MFP subunit